MNNSLFVCRYPISPLRDKPDDVSEMISQVQFGEIIELLDRQDNWIKIRQLKDSYEGWMDFKFVHPVTEKEAKRWLDSFAPSYALVRKVFIDGQTYLLPQGSFLPYSKDCLEFNMGSLNYQLSTFLVENPKNLEEVAKSYLGASYLWGGKSPFGIDCSGLSQMCYRFFDINLPRDAAQQIELGRIIDFEDIESGDLAFFINSKQKIHHVGICIDSSEIIHAHGCVRQDILTKDGIISKETGHLTHHLYQIKRI